jgi:hypothetical protein
MKPLILVLLFAISAAAQSLPEVARQERERKANLKTSHVLTTDTVKGQLTNSPATGEKPAETRPEQPATPANAPEAAKPASASSAPATAPSPAQTEAKNANDEAVKKYAEELSRLRARVVQLQDQGTALQLQINDLKNSFLAPVTDTNARAQAQTQLDQAQTQLAATEQELADTRRQVQVLEVQGPPKP